MVAYRFSATTGNVIRPIQSSCLNTTTGALVWPMVYGPAGTAITAWNGVVESYQTGPVIYRPTAQTITERFTRWTTQTGWASNAYDGDLATSDWATCTPGFAETASFAGDINGWPAISGYTSLVVKCKCSFYYDYGVYGAGARISLLSGTTEIYEFSGTGEVETCNITPAIYNAGLKLQVECYANGAQNFEGEPNGIASVDIYEIWVEAS